MELRRRTLEEGGPFETEYRMRRADEWGIKTKGVERVAPIDARHTWHDFRVTIREGERAPLSKVVVVHTDAAGDGWKITAIEGPLP